MEYLIILFSLAGIVIGANYLVSGAVSVARRFKVSDFVIGAAIVGVGTSMPEFVVSFIGALNGNADVAIGNVVGSNIFNIFCILGIAPLISPIHAPGINMVDMGTMLFITLALFPIMRSGWKISRSEGAFFLLIYCAYTVYLFMK